MWKMFLTTKYTWMLLEFVKHINADSWLVPVVFECGVLGLGVVISEWPFEKQSDNEPRKRSKCSLDDRYDCMVFEKSYFINVDADGFPHLMALSGSGGMRIDEAMDKLEMLLEEYYLKSKLDRRIKMEPPILERRHDR